MDREHRASSELARRQASTRTVATWLGSQWRPDRARAGCAWRWSSIEDLRRCMCAWERAGPAARSRLGCALGVDLGGWRGSPRSSAESEAAQPAGDKAGRAAVDWCFSTGEGCGRRPRPAEFSSRWRAQSGRGGLVTASRCSPARHDEDKAADWGDEIERRRRSRRNDRPTRRVWERGRRRQQRSGREREKERR